MYSNLQTFFIYKSSHLIFYVKSRYKFKCNKKTYRLYIYVNISMTLLKKKARPKPEAGLGQAFLASLERLLFAVLHFSMTFISFISPFCICFCHFEQFFCIFRSSFHQ